MPPPSARRAQPPEATGPAAIQTRGLTKRYGERAAVEDLTITVPRGQVVGFVGPNGAGKTTTIRMLLGLVRPTAGEARVLGQSIAKPASYLPGVGALIEAPAFYANLSGAANLRVLCRLGGFDEARIPVLLQQVGLGERGDEAYKRYSLGMKQRLGIAAALLPDPELLVLDEPTNGLDPAGILEVRTFLRSLGDAGKTVFVSSHLLAEIERMCDHVIMLRKGRLVFQGSMQELVARGAGLTLAAEDPAHHARLAEICRKAGYKVEASAEHVLVHGAGRDRAAAINRAAMKAGITLREIHSGTGDLEQTFLAMTGEGGL
ncbi:MAG: type transport system ATP-binding protein [Thermoplasmata archaeon]|jgi:ABC-2 type transport system ATP-binding protein|nr:type transport system ATP-binding protein [Thermoplasmata archaeon]